MQRVNIFLCFASKDKTYREMLETQLSSYRRMGVIQNIWHNQTTNGGMEKDFEMQRQLSASDIIVLLVSPDFLASDECYTLMEQAMERHMEGEARVVPVLLRPTAWEQAPFGKLQVLPKDEEPITNWPNQDEAFLAVAKGIYDLFKESGDTTPKKEIEKKKIETSANLPAVRAETALAIEISEEPPEFTPIDTYIDHRGPVASVAFNHDGQMLVSDSWDGTIKIRDRDARQELYTFTGHVGAVYSVIYSTDGSKLVSGGDDKTVKIWDAHQGRILQTMTGHTGPISSVVSYLEEHIVISGSDDATIILWDAQTKLPLRTLRGHTGPVSSLVLSADKKTLASGSWDGTVKLWDIPSGQERESFGTSPKSPIYGIASSPDMRLFISGGQDGIITVRDMRETETSYTLVGHTGPVSSVALSPDLRTLISGSYDKTIKVWSLASRNMVGELIGHTEAVLSVAFHPDGYTLASGSLDKSVRIWGKPQTKREPRITAPLAHEEKEQKNAPPTEPFPPLQPLETKTTLPAKRRSSVKPYGNTSSKRVCPACIQEFYPGDCKIVATLDNAEVSPNLVPRGVLTTPTPSLFPGGPPARKTVVIPKDAILKKSSPHGSLQQIRARKKPEPLTGELYTTTNASRICPFCDYHLPVNIERVQNMSIAIVGDIASGKSHYIAALIHQMRKQFQPNCLTPEREKEFIHDYLDPLFKDKHTLPSTTPIRLEGDRVRRPLIYELVIRESANHMPKKAFNLIFYDTAGEDLADTTNLVQYSRYIFHASALIFLVDLVAMPAIRDQIPPALHPNPLPKRTGFEFLNTVLRVSEQFAGSKMRRQWRNTPIAVTLSKSDIVKDITPLHSQFAFLDRHPHYHKNGLPDLEELANVNSEVQNFLEHFGDRALVDAVADFPNVQFFATSATGHSPDAAGNFPGVEPLHCLDPLLWIFSQLGILDPEVRNPVLRFFEKVASFFKNLIQ